MAFQWPHGPVIAVLALQAAAITGQQQLPGRHPRGVPQERWETVTVSNLKLQQRNSTSRSTATV
jgi:hypothetical protein